MWNLKKKKNRDKGRVGREARSGKRIGGYIQRGGAYYKSCDLWMGGKKFRNSPEGGKRTTEEKGGE